MKETCAVKFPETRVARTGTACMSSQCPNILQNTAASWRCEQGMTYSINIGLNLTASVVVLVNAYACCVGSTCGAYFELFSKFPASTGRGGHCRGTYRHSERISSDVHTSGEYGAKGRVSTHHSFIILKLQHVYRKKCEVSPTESSSILAIYGEQSELLPKMLILRKSLVWEPSKVQTKSSKRHIAKF